MSIKLMRARSLRRLAAATLFAMPLAALAAMDYTGTVYAPWSGVSGGVVWRATNATFHNATVADIASDGTIGTAYEMTADKSAKSWQRFASNQTNYAKPGMLLVYDKASSDDETPVNYTQSSEPTFGPMSFGGIWVKTLAANGSPFTISAAGSRSTEFGNAAYEGTTLFKIEKSFTINRQGQFSFLGTVNVDLAQDAVFTINSSYPNQNLVVPAGSTLVLTGTGSMTTPDNTGLAVSGTLDLSAAARPSITGKVTLNGGSTLVLPSGTEPSTETPFTICSGALAASGLMNVKIGDGEPVQATLTVSGGTITEVSVVDETEKTFTSDYPSEVPYGFTYTYVATDAVTIPAVTVNGTLKTSGPIAITDLAVASNASLEVLSGNTTVGGAGVCQLKGNITIDAGATLTNTKTDTLDYNGAMTVDVYGTLALGTTRWSIPAGCTFKVHAGAAVTGTGDSNGGLDFISGANRGLDVYPAEQGSGSVTIEGPVRVRANETRIWIGADTTLVLRGGIKDGGGHHGGFKQVGPGTLEVCAHGLSGTASILTQGKLRLNNMTSAFPVNLQGSAALEIIATEAATVVPVNATTANNNVTFSGSGKVNGSITKTSAPAGDLATFLQSSAWEGTFVADWAGANNTRFNANSYGNANSTIQVTKLAGGYIGDGSANFVVMPTINVSGTMTLDNGYSGKITTLTRLTGSGTVTFNAYTCDITTLDNFTGTFTPTDSRGTQIGTIDLASVPAAGDKIVSTGTNAKFYSLATTKVSVNGVVDDTIKLEAKADGIYVATPAAAKIGETEYTTVTEALTIAYSSAVGTVVEVLDDSFTWDTQYDTYFRWDATERTATRISDQASADNVIADSAEEAVSLVTGAVTRPAAVVDYVTAEAYAAYFTKAAVENANGTWKVSSVLDKAAVLDDEDEVLADILDYAMDDEAANIVIAAKPGLYYTLVSGPQVANRTAGTPVLAQGDTVTFAKPEGAKFFEVRVGTTAE